MRMKRLVMLTAIPLLLAAAASDVQPWGRLLPQAVAAERLPQLEGENSISNLKLEPLPTGSWRLTFDYFWNGNPDQPSTIEVQQDIVIAARPRVEPLRVIELKARRGAHTEYIEVERPNTGSDAVVTRSITILFVGRGVRVTQKIEKTIEWPDAQTYAIDRQLNNTLPAKVMKDVVGMIDSGVPYQIGQAKALLERMLEKNPKNDAAYVELARVAMKTNWNADGRRHAESLLGAALQIRPDSVDAKILLGYVYAHQKRYKEAEALFAQSERENPPNLWLWANWGEVLSMQGKDAAAAQKWREAIARPPTGDTNDRAREWAYHALIAAADARKDEPGAEALLKQRADDYPSTGCFRVDYARSLVLRRADSALALELLRGVPPAQCTNVREVQGLAHYVAWAQGKDPERAESLLRARVVLPSGPMVFYRLASTERMVPVARALIASGENILVQDKQQMDALAYAMRNRDLELAERLLKLGAKPEALIGRDQMPIALMPVIMRDLEGIRLMRRSGVDYTKLRFEGETALDYARQEGDRKLLEALDPKAGTL